MIFKYKDKYPVANKISVFNHYKRITGRSLERDMQKVQKREEVLNDESATDEEVNEALDIDIIEIMQFVYYAFRCAGEAKILEVDIVIDELDINDLMDGSLVELISKLMEVKKNSRVVLSKRSK
jgi:hypothetical protein